MSLICAETKKDMLVKEPLYTATRYDVPIYSALHHSVIDAIPQSKRRKKRCSEGDLGVDIHEGKSTPNGMIFSDVYSLSGFKNGRFLFSISKETAKQYMPNFYHMLQSSPYRRAS